MRNAFKPKFGVRDDSIISEIRGNTIEIPIDEITEILAMRVQKVTYEEDFLHILHDNGRETSVGELDVGFDQVEQALAQSLPSFPKDWRSMLEMEAEQRTQIWKR